MIDTSSDKSDGVQPGVWEDAAMRELEKTLHLVAPTDATLFIHGESGTGKERVARRAHALSKRSAGPFVKINCAALPEPLLESELFGYAAGAFTGAHANKRGRFELAQGGTIFLDEIAELSAALQAKLLQVLQDFSFTPLGTNRDVCVDVRVICATHQDLRERVASRRFREDLYYRLDVVGLRLPPLRERPDALLPLVEAFSRQYAKRYGRAVPQPSARLLAAFAGYRFPGNIRELENLVKRWVVLEKESAILDELETRPSASAFVLQSSTLLAETDAEGEELPLREVSRRAARLAEDRVIERALELCGGDLKRAAQMLGVSYKTLLSKTSLRTRGAR